MRSLRLRKLILRLCQIGTQVNWRMQRLRSTLCQRSFSRLSRAEMMNLLVSWQGRVGDHQEDSKISNIQERIVGGSWSASARVQI